MTQDKAIQFLNENATVKEWLEQRPPNTREAYGRALLRFCKFADIEPREFQQLNRIEARDLVWNFVKDLKKESNSSARIVMAALKSFYRNHDGERLPFDSSRGGKHFIGQRRKKARRRKISFMATKRIPKKVRVSFTTRKGKKVSFIATKRVPKRTKIEFYAKKRRK